MAESVSGPLEQRIRGRLRDLDAMPFIFRKLLAVLNKEYPSAREIGSVISSDPSLTLRILRMVNSAAMGARQPIASVSQAVSLLGMNTVRSVSLCLVSYDSFFQEVDERRKALWRHSLACGLIARNIAKELKGFDLEEMFIAGMLHDIGIAVLAKHSPKDFQSVNKAYPRFAHPLAAELEILGVTHADIGFWACGYWKLPENLGQAILHHHSPAQAGDFCQMASLIHIADALALRALQPSHPENLLFQPESIAMLGLDPKCIGKILEDSSQQLTEIESFVTCDRTTVRTSLRSY